MSEAQARLIIQQGPEPGTVFTLSQETARVGRSVNNDFTIDDPELSRQHAQFIRQGDGYAVQDLGSTNGTFVNYRRITSLTSLNHGDLITLGEFVALDYREAAATSSRLVPIPATEQPTATAVSPAPTPEQWPSEMPSSEPSGTVEFEAPLPPPPKRRRPWLIGCAAILLFICLFMATIFFLDSYQEGRLLYCGVLRPFWNFLLGPFGFSPVC